MNYQEAYNYIQSIMPLGNVPGLVRIKELLKRLDNPQDKLRVIHVGGTNGKGSICAYLEYGLRECGLSVGRYISPTLFDYLERFQIDGKYMSEDEFADLTTEVAEICDSMVSEGLGQPTSFEFETAIAFLYFEKKGVDIVVLEVGMGGREDATNVMEKPLATVFASISLEHTTILGKTIEEIMFNKAGITRPGVPVITYNPILTNGVPDVILERLAGLDDDVAKEELAYVNLVLGNLKNQYIAKPLITDEIKNPLKGEFQNENLAVALTTYSVLEDKLKSLFDKREDVNICYDQFKQGVEKTRWPGRFEVVSENPLIIRDGAHNPDAIERVCQEIERMYGRAHIIMGVYADKTYDEMLKRLMPLAVSFTTVTAPNPSRALDGRELASVAAQVSNELNLGLDVAFCESMELAIDRALDFSQKYNGQYPVIILGSLSLSSLVSEVLGL